MPICDRLTPKSGPLHALGVFTKRAAPYVRLGGDQPIMPDAVPSAIDTRAFRDALGSFVTGVTIVTTRGEGTDIGLTANSFNSVSLEPPMVLWSLALSSSSLPAFRQAPWWAVHILASEQEELSARFAQRGIDKFAGLAISRGPGGIPLLDTGLSRRLV